MDRKDRVLRVLLPAACAVCGILAVAGFVYAGVGIGAEEVFADQKATIFRISSVFVAGCVIGIIWTRYYFRMRRTTYDPTAGLNRSKMGNWDMDHKQLYQRPDGSKYVKYILRDPEGDKYKILNIPVDWKKDPMEYEALHQDEYSDWMPM